MLEFHKMLKIKRVRVEEKIINFKSIRAIENIHINPNIIITVYVNG